MAEQQTFRIELGAGAERDLEQLPREVQRMVLREVRRWLTTHPFQERKTRLKRLTGFVLPLYRLRIGDYRAYYRIAADRVVLLAILHKKESDRWLKNFRS